MLSDTSPETEKVQLDLLRKMTVAATTRPHA